MNKPLRFTVHAQTVVSERGLEVAWIEDAVFNPDWTEIDPSGPPLERRYRRIEERDGRILRVICLEDADEIRIITAFLDRKAQKP
ncbi:DUF4258 domain-containing protein [Rhizobium sp. RU36D]|uniref:DUF4258 domain-containing protein n=1 Tax=Rhizobium sp. RU36D TaxID=1907415 RepID=UPI0009D7D9BC|nr:DUF4258 domain-containing protein [Rhizobium sp. RU36D]SMC60759.1 Ribonuclease toxin, BrnT, of type II toxin-antitoxin system [Rhizobium sp. RU36D]